MYAVTYDPKHNNSLGLLSFPWTASEYLLSALGDSPKDEDEGPASVRDTCFGLVARTTCILQPGIFSASEPPAHESAQVQVQGQLSGEAMSAVASRLTQLAVNNAGQGATSERDSSPLPPDRPHVEAQFPVGSRVEVALEASIADSHDPTTPQLSLIHI